MFIALTLLAALLLEPPSFGLDNIMQHPDWMGMPPSGVWWTDNGEAILMIRDRDDRATDDMVRLDPATGEARVLSDTERAAVIGRRGDLDSARHRKVFAHEGDLFLLDRPTGELIRLTNSNQWESNPSFMADDASIQFRRGNRIVILDLATGQRHEPRGWAFLDEDDDEADDDDDANFLEAQQTRLIQTLGDREARSELRKSQAEALEEADSFRRPEDIRLGADRHQKTSSYSPAGRWVALTTAGQRKEAKRDTMPRFITDSSYVETQRVRPKAGAADHASGRDGEQLLMVDLEAGVGHVIDLSSLPTITDDPLGWLDENPDEVNTQEATPESVNDNATITDLSSASEQTENFAGESPGDETETSKPRAVRLSQLAWSPDGRRLVVQARSQDSKDRWIAEVDLKSDPPTLQPIHHLRDDAWIGRSFNQMDWLRDGSGLWFQSEASGFGHLYFWDATTGEIRPLTGGDWETRRVWESPHDHRLYFIAGRDRPVIRDLHAVAIDTGEIEQITDLGQSVDDYSVSPDGQTVLLEVSSATRPGEVVVQQLQPGSQPRWLTDSRSDAYRTMDLIEPAFVSIPSDTMATGKLWAKLYLPDLKTDAPRPAVLFLHGAGYLQNADNQWSNYARESLFNMRLAHQGFVVLDLDYRASSGYGRDCRTAIYRNMGAAEIEDIATAIDWLAANHNVDPNRVGAYGGSYGGFLVLMTLFHAPDLLACGAALRPVTDWAHYADNYTHNILNTPQRDPEAYRVSSPIEYAEGLAAPLLICHGMVDNNVLFKDTVRLTQRLIELGKTDWEIAIYPVEAHGFREDSSWIDEYRRIDALFEEHLLTSREAATTPSPESAR